MRQTGEARKTFRREAIPALLPILAVVVANTALAFGPLLVRLADVGPVAAAFWRVVLALPVLLPVAWMVDARGLGEGLVRHWPLLALAGLAFAVDLGSWHIGIVRTSLANATLFGNSATLIFPIYGFVMARAWPNRWQALALALAMAGAGLLMGRSAELSARHLAGDLFCIVAGVFYAVYFIGISRVRTALSPVPTLALSSIATTVPLLGFAVLLGERILPGNWTPLLALAIGSQLIGQGLMVYALGRLSPLVVGIALLIQPIVAAVLGWMVFDERLQPLDLVGAALVAAALVLVRLGRARPVEVAPPANLPRHGNVRRKR